jgi:hypothetical protein
MQQSMPELLVELFTAIKLIAGYPIPAALPEVHVMPLTELRREVCADENCRVEAYYDPKRGVLLGAHLDVHDNLLARSILLHELVHHVQQKSGRFETIPSECRRWVSKEREAYNVQNQYLQRHGSATIMTWTVLAAGVCNEPEPTPRD